MNSNQVTVTHVLPSELDHKSAQKNIMIPLVLSLAQPLSCATLVCPPSLTKSAALVSQASQPVYQPPLVITKGGTYSGNWQSLDNNVPAVKIQTSEPVVIQNSSLQGRGDLILAIDGNANLTVRNTKGYGLNPNVNGKAIGKFLWSYKATNIVVENCYMKSLDGIKVWDDGTTTNITVKIRYNRVSNIDERKSDGQGGLINDAAGGNFVQLNQVQNIANIEIAWNEVINEPHQSNVGDTISIYKSGGTSANPILIHDNYIQGAYLTDPTLAYYGGVIMLSDDSEAANNGANVGFVQAFNNQIVSTANYGIAIAAGHDNQFYNNRIVSSGQLSDGTHLSGGLGAYIWDFYQNKSNRVFYNNFAHNNTIGVVNGGNGQRNDSWFPNCASGKCTNNTSMPGPITPDTEKTEFQAWQNKISSNNATIGPDF